MLQRRAESQLDNYVPQDKLENDLKR